MYGAEVQIKLSAEQLTVENKSKHILDKNLLVVGDANFENNIFNEAISFAEEFVDFLSLPFVPYILVSTSEENLKKVESELIKSSSSYYDNFEKLESLKKFSDESQNYIVSNLPSVTVQLEEQDIEGIQSLMQLPYFHGVIKEMIDIKFI